MHYQSIRSLDPGTIFLYIDVVFNRNRIGIVKEYPESNHAKWDMDDGKSYNTALNNSTWNPKVIVLDKIDSQGDPRKALMLWKFKYEC